MLTPTMEDYLKAIYLVCEETGQVKTVLLAERLGVSAASVSGMLKRLTELGFISHAPWQGAHLTEQGERVALTVLRHHRLVECFLVEVLALPWDEVHEIADEWEHLLSELLEARMDALLDHPEVDPHGAPIPTREGYVPPQEALCLADLPAGQAAIIARVHEHDPALLRYFATLGCYPGTPLEVTAKTSCDHLLTIRVGGVSHHLGESVGRHIFVTPLPIPVGAHPDAT